MGDINKIDKNDFLSPSEVRELMNGLGFQSLEIVGINKGFENEVYDITITPGEHVILRVRKKGDTEFRQEAWAINEVKKVGAPVAQILFVGTVLVKGKETDVMIQSKMPGLPFEEIHKNIGAEVRGNLLFKMGKILRSIHSISVEGFGKRLNGGSWEYKTREEYMTQFIVDRMNETDLMLDAGLTKSEFDDTIESINIFKDKYLCESPTLCHGDYMPPHVMIEGEQISGIIDFGLFQGNSPFYDVSYFLLCVPDDYKVEFIRGYLNVGEIKDFNIQLQLESQCILFKHIGRLAHPYRRAKKEEELAFSVRRLRVLL